MGTEGLPRVQAQMPPRRNDSSRGPKWSRVKISGVGEGQWASLGLAFPACERRGHKSQPYVRIKRAHTHGVPHCAWPVPITNGTRPEERET